MAAALSHRQPPSSPSGGPLGNSVLMRDAEFDGKSPHFEVKMEGTSSLYEIGESNNVVLQAANTNQSRVFTLCFMVSARVFFGRSLVCG